MQPVTIEQTIRLHISPLDNSYTNASPCKDQKREYECKELCVDICNRMVAYRAGLPYSHIPCVEVPEFVDEKEFVKCLHPDCDKMAEVRGFCNYHSNRWRRGKILHPIEGVWTRQLIRMKRGKLRPRGLGRIR